MPSPTDRSACPTPAPRQRAVILSEAKDLSSIAPLARALALLSSRAARKRVRGICFSLLFTLAAGLFLTASLRAQEPRRPHMFGIARVTFYSTNTTKARPFYKQVLALHEDDCSQCDKFAGPIFVNKVQQVLLLGAPKPTPSTLVSEIIFSTDDVPQLRLYLKAHHVEVIEPLESEAKSAGYLSVKGPEGVRISFTQHVRVSGSGSRNPAFNQSSRLHLIHAGFIVRDRAATEHFYKDILGFRPYWHGGMKDDQTDWVSLQVPDGTDWVELMVNVPSDADKRLRGVMNHIALGVPDIHAAEQRLLKNGMKLTEQPKIGRDGKWQLNLYDPDGTRVELMEFTPSQKPCCSEYTGPHPKP